VNIGASGGFDQGNIILQYTAGADVVVSTVPANTSYIVSCRIFASGSEALADGRVTALQVGAVN